MLHPVITSSPQFSSSLSEEDARVQARLLQAIADPHRLRILNLLSRHEGDMCVLEMQKNFTLCQPTLSHHLRILRDAGLVDFHKRKLYSYYFIRRIALAQAEKAIREVCAPFQTRER